MFNRQDVISGATFSNTINPYIYQTGMMCSGSRDLSNDMQNEEEHQNQQQYFDFSTYREAENNDIIEDQIMKARKRRQKLKVDFKFTDH